MTWDICIHGRGITGHALALRLAQQRLRVALVGHEPPHAARDVRAYALNAASQQLLHSSGAWPEAVAGAITPVLAMQVWGKQGATLRFEASACDQAALGWMVDVPTLSHALREAVAAQPLISTLPANGAPVDARLRVVCEGKTSALRTALGVTFDAWPYPQHALATRLHTERPHQGVARQWFVGGDVLAFLPMDGPQGHTVGVVWSTDPAQATQLAGPEQSAALCERLSHLSQHALGALRLAAPAAVWPLQRAQARQWCGRDAQGAWVLAGDAAHVVHPLAGQGLNLGLADVALLADMLQARAYWRAVDDAALLRRYARNRQAATQTMVWGTDSLYWLFAQNHPFWTQARNWGLNQVNHLNPLKHWLAKQAMNP